MECLKLANSLLRMFKDLETEMENKEVEIQLVDQHVDRKTVSAMYSKLRQSLQDAAVVGIDCEGTDGHKGIFGPLTVQVASAGVVVVEVPSSPGKYSQELCEILADEGIQKVFCQGKNAALPWK